MNLRLVVGVVALLFAATTTTTTFAAPLFLAASDAPQQVHIALGDTEGTAVVVAWITDSEKSGDVQFGETSSLGKTVKQTEEAKSYTYVNGKKESYTSGLIHFVNVTGLAHNTKYYYKCGTDSSGYSKVYSFTTPPPVDAKSPIVINWIGDLGQTENSSSTIAHINSDTTAHFTVLVGDLSYADSSTPSTPGHNCTQKRWDSWGQLVEYVFANQPLMVGPGNHEIEYALPPATQQSFLAFQSRFRMPSEASGATNGNLYYSFNAGPVHIVMLNSYMDFSRSSDQYKWLEADLKSVDRSVTPWLVANMHAPWYNSDMHHHDEPEEIGMRLSMEPLMKTYNVDLVFSGHVHAYERMYPVYNNVTQPGATTYINIGDGGNREGPATGYYPKPSWSAYREPSFGHGRFEVFNQTHAHFTWHKNEFSEGTVSDDVWLVRNSAISSNPYTTGLAHINGREFDGYAPAVSF